jgi:hypothetical protein
MMAQFTIYNVEDAARVVALLATLQAEHEAKNLTQRKDEAEPAASGTVTAIGRILTDTENAAVGGAEVTPAEMAAATPARTLLETATAFATAKGSTELAAQLKAFGARRLSDLDKPEAFQAYLEQQLRGAE